MRQYEDSIASITTGLPVFQAEIRVLKADSTPAQLYSDNGVTTLAQPVLSDGTGYFRFFVADGTYTLVIADPGGVNSRSFPNIEIYEDARNVSVPPGEQGVTVPSASVRMNMALGFDNTGAPIAIPASGLATTTAAQAAAAAALVSQNAAAASATTASGAATTATGAATTATTQAGNAANSASTAATARDAAIIASGITGSYPNSAASNVPRGLTQASVGAITAGSGGTNGTFALAWSSGNFAINPTGTFTVAGGVLTAVTITGPGEYIGASPTVPTPSFAASSGLSGAAVALTAQFLVGSGQGYWVQSSDNTQLLHYLNSSGTATADTSVGPISLNAVTGVFPGTAPPTIYGLASVGPGNAAFSAGTARWIGTATENCTLLDIDDWYSSLGNGHVDLTIASGTLPAQTAVSTVAMTLAAAGGRRWTSADFGTINLLAGQSVWLSTPSGGPPSYTKTGTANTGYDRLAPFTTGSFTATALSSGQVANARFRTTKPAVAVPRVDLVDKPTLDQVGAVTSSKPGAHLGFAGTVINSSAFNPANYVYLGTAATTDKLGVYQGYVRVVGNGNLNILITRGDHTAVSGIVGVYPLTALAAVGDTGRVDISALNIVPEVGDDIWIGGATSGVTFAQQSSGGSGYYYAPSSTPAIGGTINSTHVASPAAFSAYVEQSATGVVIGINDLSTAVQQQIANASVPAYVAPTTYVMFLVAGQSNGQGQGNSALSPTMAAGMAYQYYAGSLTAITADPVGNANTGSMLPAFANEFYLSTGMGCIFVPTCVLGSSLQAAAQTSFGNWSSTGAIRASAISACTAAQAAATSAGLAWQFGGVLWVQGETDADGIDTGGGTKGTAAGYKTEFGSLYAAFETAFGTAGANIMPFCIWRTGTKNTGDTAGYVAIRAAQMQLAQTYPNVRLVFTGTVNYLARGLMIDLYHYSQAGLNEMGTKGATMVAYATAGRA